MLGSDAMQWRYARRMWGTAPALKEEIEKAREIAAGAPEGDDVLAVARYFRDLGERNADGEPYNAEWRSRSNPLIVEFFSATDYGRANDQVKWCAAFVNWCLRRARRRFTESASSGSFRCFGEATDAPVPGDIVVFKNRGQDHRCSGSGHVGLFVGQSAGQLQVLGGNQGNRVSEKTYTSTPGPTQRLQLIGYRRVS